MISSSYGKFYTKNQIIMSFCSCQCIVLPISSHNLIVQDIFDQLSGLSQNLSGWQIICIYALMKIHTGRFAWYSCVAISLEDFVFLISRLFSCPIQTYRWLRVVSVSLIQETLCALLLGSLYVTTKFYQSKGIEIRIFTMRTKAIILFEKCKSINYSDCAICEITFD